MNSFEHQLLAHLRAEHDADSATLPRSRPRRRALQLTAGVAVIAVMAVVAVLAFSASTGTPRASAVTLNADGSITVTLTDIAQMSNLNAELASLGYPIRAIPVTADCQDSEGILPNLWPGHVMTDTIVLGTHFTAGQHEVIGAQEVANGQVELNIVTMSAGEPVPTCFGEKGALG